jgi:hypothetical protein
MQSQTYPCNPTLADLAAHACITTNADADGCTRRICAPTPMVLDILRCQTNQSRTVDAKVAVIQYYVNPQTCVITNSKGVAAYLRIFEDESNVEATTLNASVYNLKHPTTNVDVLDLDASDVLGPIPIQTKEVGAWSSLFGVKDAAHVRHSIAKKNAQLKRISNDRSQELKDRESAVSDEASNKRRDGGKNITTLDDFVAGRIGLAASRLHLRYCDVVDEKTKPIVKTETMVMDRLEQIIPPSILAHYFYANMLRGGMTTDALRDAVESVRRGEVVNVSPPTEQAMSMDMEVDPVAQPTPHPSLEDFPFLFRAGDEAVVLVPPPTTTRGKGKGTEE